MVMSSFGCGVAAYAARQAFGLGLVAGYKKERFSLSGEPVAG